MRMIAVIGALALAAGSALADGLTFSGFVSGWAGGTVSASYSVGGSNVTVSVSNVMAGADGYVNATVVTDAPVPDDTRVDWTFTDMNGGQVGSVSRVVRRVPYALVADVVDRIVPTNSTFVAKERMSVATATVANSFRIAGDWVAPQVRVTLGDAEAQTVTMRNADVSLPITDGNARRLHVLETVSTNRVSIAGGRNVEDLQDFEARSDGLLEIRLAGVVAYSKDAAYGDRPNRDTFCRICALVAMDLRDARGTNQLDEVFGAFRANEPASRFVTYCKPTGRSDLVYRPWIVPSARLSGTDGVMDSRLMLPMRRGDRFTLALAYAEYFPDGDTLRPTGGGSRFIKVREPVWVGADSHAEAELVFHSFGGGK